jgi:hypothetical protein
LSELEARRAVVEEAIAWFRDGLEGVLKTVADSVAAMKATATALSVTSNETTAHTASAVETSNDVEQNHALSHAVERRLEQAALRPRAAAQRRQPSHVRPLFAPSSATEQSLTFP